MTLEYAVGYFGVWIFIAVIIIAIVSSWIDKK